MKPGNMDVFEVTKEYLNFTSNKLQQDPSVFWKALGCNFLRTLPDIKLFFKDLSKPDGSNDGYVRWENLGSDRAMFSLGVDPTDEMRRKGANLFSVEEYVIFDGDVPFVPEGGNRFVCSGPRNSLALKRIAQELQEVEGSSSYTRIGGTGIGFMFMITIWIMRHRPELLIVQTTTKEKKPAHAKQAKKKGTTLETYRIMSLREGFLCTVDNPWMRDCPLWKIEGDSPEED